MGFSKGPISSPPRPGTTSRPATSQRNRHPRSSTAWTPRTATSSVTAARRCVKSSSSCLTMVPILTSSRSQDAHLPQRVGQSLAWVQAGPRARRWYLPHLRGHHRRYTRCHPGRALRQAEPAHPVRAAHDALDVRAKEKAVEAEAPAVLARYDKLVPASFLTPRMKGHEA